MNPSHSETISAEILFDIITKITKLALKLFYDVLKETKDSKDFLISKDPILTKNLIDYLGSLRKPFACFITNFWKELQKEPAQIDKRDFERLVPSFVLNASELRSYCYYKYQ